MLATHRFVLDTLRKQRYLGATCARPKSGGRFPESERGGGGADLARAAYKIRVLSPERVLKLLWGSPGALGTASFAADNQGREGEEGVSHAGDYTRSFGTAIKISKGRL